MLEIIQFTTLCSNLTSIKKNLEISKESQPQSIKMSSFSIIKISRISKVNFGGNGKKLSEDSCFNFQTNAEEISKRNINFDEGGI
jgi:hypothetical protein